MSSFLADAADVYVVSQVVPALLALPLVEEGREVRVTVELGKLLLPLDGHLFGRAALEGALEDATGRRVSVRTSTTATDVLKVESVCGAYTWDGPRVHLSTVLPPIPLGELELELYRTLRADGTGVDEALALAQVVLL